MTYHKSTVMTVEVSRGTTHDGPGLRTTVFTKGCPLACRWCQNPESITPGQEIWYEAAKCIGCSECVKICPNAALGLNETGIQILRSKCTGCGACVKTCPAKALSLTGTVWTSDGLVHEVLKDKPYYKEFGGGVTVSGGEPLLHADFLQGFFQKLKANGIHTALDTCGCLSGEALMQLIPQVDAILYDIKLLDGAKHKALTGRGNRQILDNLTAVAEYIRQLRQEENRKILLWIRTPLIPGDTSTKENIEQIAGFITENILDVTERWELCAFNAACSVKYVKMQRPWPYEGIAAMKQSDTDKLKGFALARGIPEDKLIVTGIVIQS